MLIPQFTVAHLAPDRIYAPDSKYTEIFVPSKVRQLICTSAKAPIIHTRAGAEWMISLLTVQNNRPNGFNIFMDMRLEVNKRFL